MGLLSSRTYYPSRGLTKQELTSFLEHGSVLVPTNQILTRYMTKFRLAVPTTASKSSLVQPVSKYLLYLTGTTLILLEECVTMPVLTASL